MLWEIQKTSLGGSALISNLNEAIPRKRKLNILDSGKLIPEMIGVILKKQEKDIFLDPVFLSL
jgi:hypothetical protein